VSKNSVPVVPETLRLPATKVKIAWHKLFKSTWNDFNTQFKRLLENLRRHRHAIENQASLIEIEQNQLSREAQEKQDRQSQAFSIIGKLSPANMILDQEIFQRCWSKNPDFGNWLFDQDKLKAWLDSTNTDAAILWLRGIPGAG